MIENMNKYEKFDFPKTRFVGFDKLKDHGKIQALFNQNCESVPLLKGNGYIIFDITPFYAMGGGQSSDKGFITINGKKIDVIDVRKDIVKKYYIHEVETEFPLKINDEVFFEVDSEFRQASCRNHSALHITWMTIIKLIGHHVNEIGSKLNDEKYQLQYAVDEKLTPELCVEALNKINNEIIKKDIPAHIFEVTREEAIAKNYMYEFTKIDGDDLVRIVEFKDVVIEPCGGTHVKKTSEIKKSYFLNYDKNAKRILIDYTTNAEYANGYFLKKFDEPLKRIIGLINNNNSIDFTEEQKLIASLPKEKSYMGICAVNNILNSTTFKVNKRLTELKRVKLTEFLNSNVPEETINKITLIALESDLIDAKMLLAKGSQLVLENPKKVYCLINKTKEEVLGLMICDKNNGIDLRDKMKTLAEKTEFKGGGSPSMYQIKSSVLDDYNHLIAFLKKDKSE